MADKAKRDDEAEALVDVQSARSSGVTVAPVHAETEALVPDNASSGSSSGYHEAGEWKGMPHWECDSCAYDSLSEDVIKSHVVTHNVVRPRSPLVDERGRPFR